MRRLPIAQTKVEVEIPADVIALCNIFDISPQALLRQYMCDLCSLPGSQGSDERHMAKWYFLRGGLASGVNFDFKEGLVEEFEQLYQKNYPSVSNETHRDDREVQLLEMYERVMKLQNGGV